MVTLFGPLLAGRLRSFAGLSVTERGEVLESLAHSRLYLLREIPMLLKMVASLGYLGVPQVQRELGVPSVDREPPEWARSKS